MHLGIEIDGHWHFQDAEHYRRDRRKDWLLQRHGCVVLRFLATDVLERLEEILATVLEAVAWRRAERARAPRSQGADHERRVR